jgi:hypothetical protein
MLERDKRDKTPSFFGGLLCHPLLRWGMVWYPTNVGEGESERSLLIQEKERERMKEECSKCGEIYNPHKFGELHWGDEGDCNGKPINEIQYFIEERK